MTGRDLVAPTATQILTTDANSGIFQTIPSNPALWTGTRISVLAKAYQYYRPLRFCVTYVPQVSVTQPGNVILGTLWQTDTSDEAIQQTLLTSPGGRLTQCYLSATSHVPMGKHLPQKQFVVFGNPANQQCVPFNWLAMYTGSNAASAPVPGYVVVDWEYELINPMGETTNQAGSITQETQEMVTNYILNRNITFEIDSLTPLWGFAIGLLKTIGGKILDKAAVLVLDAVDNLATQVKVGVGKMLTYVKERTMTLANDELFTVCKDPLTDENVILPDDTRVVLYQTGRTTSQTTPSTQTIKITTPVIDPGSISTCHIRVDSLTSQIISGLGQVAPSSFDAQFSSAYMSEATVQGATFDAEGNLTITLSGVWSIRVLNTMNETITREVNTSNLATVIYVRTSQIGNYQFNQPLNVEGLVELTVNGLLLNSVAYSLTIVLTNATYFNPYNLDESSNNPYFISIRYDPTAFQPFNAVIQRLVNISTSIPDHEQTTASIYNYTGSF